PALVEREHRRGMRVNVWTCNDPAAMRRLVAMGVDSIMTDRPDLLKRVLDEREAN
ncbi:MAG: glycerophosphodiester phosphodiesterase, partial [Caldilineae bacterium]